MGGVERIRLERQRFEKSNGSHPYDVPDGLGDEEFAQVVTPTFKDLLAEDRRFLEVVIERARQFLQRVAAVI